MALAKLKADAASIGFAPQGCTTLLTAASELMQNTLKYANGGVLKYWDITAGQRIGIEVTVSDDGPGIPNIDEALQDNFSTSNTLGLGLPGVRRLVDEFTLESEPGDGTVATFRVYRGKHA